MGRLKRDLKQYSSDNFRLRGENSSLLKQAREAQDKQRQEAQELRNMKARLRIRKDEFKQIKNEMQSE